MTLIVLIVVTAPVVVANLNHDERPPIDKGWPPPNPAYGWPLIWYWCDFKPSSPSRMAGAVATHMHTEVVEWGGLRLAGNVAVWLVMLAAVGSACQWLLRRYGSRWTCRPRTIAFIVLIVVAAPTVLANLSPEYRWGWSRPWYGWPLTWYWRDWQLWYGASTELDYNFSAARLTGNLVMWLLMLVASGVASEWLLRRYQPRFRWSLRTMLAAVGLLAAICAWGVQLRARAKVQDPIIAMMGEALSSRPPYLFMSMGDGSPHLYLERWGPKWLDLVGADRFRRRIVGADVQWSKQGDEEKLKRLAAVPDLRYLKIEIRAPMHGMAASLAQLRQLRTLRIDTSSTRYSVSQECLAAVGELTRLEELHLGNISDSRGLVHLEHLTNLKSLSLGLVWDLGDDEDEPGEPDTNLDSGDEDEKMESTEAETNQEMPSLAYLPALPRLEAVDIRSETVTIDDEDIRGLAILPRLRSLNLNRSSSNVTSSSSNITDEGLAELASLKSLEELGIYGVTSAGCQTLSAVKGLKVLHIQRYVPVTKEILEVLPSQDSLNERDGGKSQAEQGVLGLLKWFKDEPSDRLTTVALDHGDRILAWESEVDGFQRALDALRQAHPGIVIDSDPKWFDQRRGEMRDPKLPGQP
ncbi:MAG TPA: hypothetical protein VG125_06305 [Pirellulales bacterium]|nr:hypothetical protein [Pirellulales bacterium]